MGYTRLRGNVTPLFIVKLAGEVGPATSYADSLKAYDLTDADRDDVTFAEAESGDTADYTFKLKCLVSWESGSLYGFMLDHPGAVVDVLFAPRGNALASPSSPHYLFQAVLPARPGLSMEAAIGGGKGGAEIEREWKLVEPYDLVTA